jgi:hypothetical protein
MRHPTLLPLLLILPLLALTTGCSDNDGPTAPVTPTFGEQWAGDYNSNVRWGGADGTWRNAPGLTVTNDGTVIYGGKTIENPTIEGNQVSWARGHGNDHNVEITFHAGHSSDFFWRDSGGSITGKVFTGWRQSAGEGPLDFRGMGMPR